MKTPLQVTDPALIEQAIRRTESNINRISLIEKHGPEDTEAEKERLKTIKNVLRRVQRNG